MSEILPNPPMSTQWQNRFIDVLSAMGGRVPEFPLPRNPSAVHYAPIDSGRQLYTIRTTLAFVLYGQDPFIQLLDTMAGYPQRTTGDSVPYIFDVSPASRFPGATGWQQAQLAVMTTLASVLPTISPAALPKACQYLDDAIRALSKVEMAASPTEQGEIAALRGALTKPKGCVPNR